MQDDYLVLAESARSAKAVTSVDADFCLFSGVWCMKSIVGTLQEAGNHKLNQQASFGYPYVGITLYCRPDQCYVINFRCW